MMMVMKWSAVVMEIKNKKHQKIGLSCFNFNLNLNLMPNLRFIIIIVVIVIPTFHNCLLMGKRVVVALALISHPMGINHHHHLLILW